MAISRTTKILLAAVGILVGLAVIAAIALNVFLASGGFKSRVEAAASQTTGMDVVIDGKPRFQYLPHPAVRLPNVHARKNGKDVLVAAEATLEMDFLPLLRRELRLRRIALEHPAITIEQARDGTFNFQSPTTAGRVLPAFDSAGASLSHGTFRYIDRQSDWELVADDCSASATRLHFGGGAGSDFMRALSVAATVGCGHVRSQGFAATDLSVAIAGKDGVFDLDPITLRVFGGGGTAGVHAAFGRAAPQYVVRYSLAGFRIEDFFSAQVPQKVVEGGMEFSAALTAEGRTIREIRQSARGTISLRGRDLTVHGSDLDEEFAQFKSSQNFNLVDVGAFFFAGPFGVAVTKGYNFASISRNPKSASAIRALVSDWKVERGVAQAVDVAMATDENRIALQGALDLVNERFDDVTVALVDAQGCAVVKQEIRGSFHRPEFESPNVLRSLAGPVISLLHQGRSLFPGGKCTAFYSGSIAAHGK